MRCLVFASNNENADVSTLHSRSATRAKLFFYLLLPAVQNSTPWSFQRKKEGEKDKYIQHIDVRSILPPAGNTMLYVWCMVSGMVP